jgi:5'-3' exonuclease
MGQPIRKKIQEVHADLIKEPPFRTLLVDGNSLLYKCFADTKVNSDGVIVGPITRFLTQIRLQLEKGEFEYIYVFFDIEGSGLLRYQYYSPYKANRDKNYEKIMENLQLSNYGKAVEERLNRWKKKHAKVTTSVSKKFNPELHRDIIDAYKVGKIKEFKIKKDYPEDIAKKIIRVAEDELLKENFDRCRDILCEMFNELYIRWNVDEVTEGDDMIAYYCLHKKENEKIIIVSGDMDLSQLIADDIAIYNLNIKEYITPKNFKSHFGYHYENTLLKKIFCGDVSDNISNIKGLSETGLMEMMPEIKTRKVTVEEVKDRARELINERISQKKKPYVLHENIVNGVSNKEYDGDFYEINDKIINLHHPLLSEEAKESMDAMMYAPMDPEGRSIKNLYKIILDQNIQDLQSDSQFSGFFRPFKKLEEKELKRFNESQK